ncbi:MAG: magnesium transporter [Nanoarchaeota archaeon]|nr:magnesium transporter [Nanoarchaeota archaeon]
MTFLGKTKKRIDKDVLEVSGASILSITISSIAGFLLTFMTDKLTLLPGFLIILPGFLEMHGNLLGALAGRIGAGLNNNKISTHLKTSPFIIHNFLATLILGIITSLFLGTLAAIVVKLLFGITDYNIIIVSLIALLVSILIELPISIILTYWSYNHGYDPDDVMGPYVTTIGDILGILALIITFKVLIL